MCDKAEIRRLEKVALCLKGDFEDMYHRAVQVRMPLELLSTIAAYSVQIGRIQNALLVKAMQPALVSARLGDAP